MKLKRGKNGRFQKARKGNPSKAAAAPRRRRRKNASSSSSAPRRRRRANPGMPPRSTLAGVGIGLGTGLALGAVSYGVDLALDPALIANGWKRGAMDAGGGLLLAGLAAFAGMPRLATALAAGTGTLAGFRMVAELAKPDMRRTRAMAVIARVDALEGRVPTATGATVPGVPRRRALPGLGTMPALPAPGYDAGVGMPRTAAARVL